MPRKEFQTLTEPMYYILLSLIEPMHGYEIMNQCKILSHERVEVGAGTLYALLSRFEEEKFIERVDGSGRKKVYKITDKGIQLLLEERNRLIKQLEEGTDVLVKGGFIDEKV